MALICNSLNFEFTIRRNLRGCTDVLRYTVTQRYFILLLQSCATGAEFFKFTIHINICNIFNVKIMYLTIDYYYNNVH